MGPAAIAAIQAGAMIASQLGQNRANRRETERAYDRNVLSTDRAYDREMDLLKFQLDYNSPHAQMQRYKDAGLNPNLIYGQGSPGNMQSAPNVPQTAPSQPTQISFMAPDVASMYQDARLKAAQTDFTSAKTDESVIKQDLIKAQTDVAKANPYLAPGYVSSIVAQMKSAAKLKEQEAGFMTEKIGGTYHGTDLIQAQERGRLIMDKQMDALFQKYDLAEQDKRIKAQIVMSKDFQNELSKIQVEWMKNADITPQHIYQGIFMLLQNLMR